MITRKHYDVVVIGAGAAGMAAAHELARAQHTVAVLDREGHLGGILQQCIHNGFGLHRFNQELTGPEYAEQYAEMLRASPADLFFETTAVDIRTATKSKTVYAFSAGHGVLELSCRAVVLAMGCRERNRGNIGIPGLRPAGVFTAGLAQRLLNIDGCVPGKKVVIVGSGDIGLIMARRLTWVGAKVQCVVEIQPHPSGLTRNIVQCLQDFSIPLHLSHSVTMIKGADRVRGVEISPLENGVPVAGKSFGVDCDTVLLSVGLIPENELSRTAGVALSPNTNGPIVDHQLQTSVEGIFACGNVLHVHDLVDYVSEESERCGRHVSAYLAPTRTRRKPSTPLSARANLKYVIPNACAVGDEAPLLMRALVVCDKAILTVRQGDAVIAQKTLRHVRPAEMISLRLSKAQTQQLRADVAIEVSLQQAT